MSAYINSYVFELYDFSALVPESYIAQTVGLILMALLMSLFNSRFFSFMLDHQHDKTIADHQPLTTANDKTIADHQPHSK